MRLISVCTTLALLLPSLVNANEHESPAPAAEHGTAAKEEHGESHGEHAREKMSEHSARTSSRDVKIPSALVAKIESEYKAFLLTSKEGSPKKEAIKRSLININAELTQKSPGALHENTRVNMPTGGGVVDLSELVTPVRGAFRLKLNATKEDGSPLATSRVFFVSRSKRRILGGEEYGAGCNQFMEITSAFHKKWQTGGLDLYTADQRYLSVLGGTFIFTDFDKEALYVGSVTFTDSRHPDLMCE